MLISDINISMLKKTIILKKLADNISEINVLNLIIEYIIHRKKFQYTFMLKPSEYQPSGHLNVSGGLNVIFDLSLKN